MRTGHHLDGPYIRNRGRYQAGRMLIRMKLLAFGAAGGFGDEIDTPDDHLGKARQVDN